MRYLMFYTTTDFETHEVWVDSEEFDNFEKMMRRFTLLSESRGNVLVIEPDTKKVVCHYKSDGKALFNRVLLDGTIYMNESE